MNWKKYLLLMGLMIVLVMSSELISAVEYGGTLTVGSNKLQPSLDPHHNMGFGLFELNIAYNTLISYNQQLEFEPELAVSWEIPDNKTYIFHLRKGVKFHDGTEFNAEAVKWNIERMISEYSQVRSYFKEVEQVEVIDNWTVKITLQKAFAPFLDSLAGNGQIVSPQAVEKLGNEGFQKQPVGTGPFKFASLDPQNGEMIFERFTDYWMEGKPYLDQIVIKEIPDGQTRLFSLTVGQVDYIYPVPAGNIKQLAADQNIKLLSLLSKSNTIDYLTFNCAVEPFDDPRVRQAIGYAIDQEKIIGFLENTEMLYGPLPEHSWGSNPDKPRKDFNPDKAKQLLAEAGYADGLEVTLKIWSNDPQQSDLALIVDNMLAKIGIKVKIEVLETATLIQQLIKGDFQLASLHWGGGGSLDPNGNLHILFSSSGQNNWICNYHNPAVEPYLQQALESTDREQRQQLYWQAEEIIINDQPMIWFGQFVSYLAYSAKVHGIDPLKPSGYAPVYHNIWIEQ